MYGLIGIAYLTDCVLNAMMERSERRMYEMYITDCLYIACAGLGNKPDKRYYDMIHPPKEEEEPDGGDVYERLDRFGIKVVD